jgi:hypothetical protein
MARNRGTDPFTLGMNAYMDFIKDCNVMDLHTCARAEIEMCFLTASTAGPKAKWNVRRNLLRFQFMEAIVNVALAKYLKSNAVGTVPEAVQLLLSETIEPRAKWHDSQAYRTRIMLMTTAGENNMRMSNAMQPHVHGKDRIKEHLMSTTSCQLYIPSMNVIFQEHLSLLKEIFRMFAGSIDSTAPPPSSNASFDFKQRRMSLPEFMFLCEQVMIIDEALPAREVHVAFVQAKETEARTVASRIDI